MVDPNPPIVREIPPPAYCAVAFSIDARDREAFGKLTAMFIDDIARNLLLRWIYGTPEQRDAMYKVTK